MLGTFVGDALGMPYEGLPPESAPDPPEMEEARLGRGTYTDDTEMMICVAEVLAWHGTADPHALASRFLAVHDPDRGYGAGTRGVFKLWREGVSVHVAARLVFDGKGSFGNGAAMRIAPIGAHFAGDPERLADEARRSAVVTHSHPVGVDGAVAQATAIGAAARGEEIVAATQTAAESEELRTRLSLLDQLRGEGGMAVPAVIASVLGNDSAAHGSVPAAIYAACEAESFEQAVGLAVRIGGDADTIGAMSGAIAGARWGLESIPGRWLDALENGHRGRDYVERLAERLSQD
jgi:ADP-ribosylglycohydrolase